MNEALAEQIAWYLDLNKREKQLSPHTIKAYHIDLKQFLSFVGGRAVEKEVLSQYIKHLNSVFLPVQPNEKLPVSALFIGNWNSMSG